MNLFNYLMGNTQSIRKVNYEDVQALQKKTIKGLLINTLSADFQSCLINGTVPIIQEEKIINELITNNPDIYVVVYGKNSNDESIYKKYKQLSDLGFSNVRLYIGGLFEWLLLQDIYGSDNFKTTIDELDILKYKPQSALSNSLMPL